MRYSRFYVISCSYYRTDMFHMCTAVISYIVRLETEWFRPLEYFRRCVYGFRRLTLSVLCCQIWLSALDIIIWRNYTICCGWLLYEAIVSAADMACVDEVDAAIALFLCCFERLISTWFLFVYWQGKDFSKVTFIIKREIKPYFSNVCISLFTYHRCAPFA